MKEFKVELSETQEGYITVKANDRKEAERKAFQLVNKCGFDLLDPEIFRKIVYRKVSRL